MPRTGTKRRPQHLRVVAAIVPPVVDGVVQPVARRLARIEALLIEMRFGHDVQTKRINALKEQLDVLTEKRLSKRQRKGREDAPAQRARGAGPRHSR